MPVSSVLVRTRAGEGPTVSQAIGELEGATVVKATGDRLVALTETTSADADQALWQRIREMPGVVDVNLVYHNFEDLAESESR